MAALTEIDVYRSANTLLDRYGEDAAVQAAMRANTMLEQGDMEGYAVMSSFGYKQTPSPHRSKPN